MRGIHTKFIKKTALIAGISLGFISAARATQTPLPSCEVLISVPDQRLELVRDGQWIAKFPISTSRFGTGDRFGSYRTPLGDLRVCDKIGENLTPGTVIRHRAATGEVLPVNAPGRDPIVTRVIWLDGLEAQNKNARVRGIYIHGTPEERTIGTPVSWGCIRMRSKDVIKVFDQVPVGTVVSIIPSKLPHLRRYQPPKEQPAPPPESNDKPPAATPASAPSGSQAKPLPEPEKPASKSPKPAVTAPESTPAAPPPAIGEAPETGTASAWRAMKGSFLLANLPGFGSKSDSHKKATQ